MIPARRSAEAAFARHLLPLARRWRQAADAALSELGLSNSDGWVLVHVGRTADRIHQAVLADKVGISGASLVRRLHQLEAAGLIVREQDAADRRVNHVRLTARGRALATEIEEAFVRLRATLLADIPDADIAVANGVLALLDDRITRLRNDTP